MKITDLNVLEYIFGYSDSEDLVNVALSDTKLQNAADIVFKRKYSKNYIYLSGYESESKLSCCIGAEETNIEFSNLMLVFGEFILKIALGIHSEDQKIRKLCDDVFDAISKQAKNLVEIEFCNFSKGWIRKFSQPLPKIKCVTLRNCDLSDTTCLLSAIFPKLCRLEIDTRREGNNQIITHFPYLKSLELNIESRRASEYESLLKLNPQLKALKLSMDHYNVWKLVRFIADGSQIESFRLYTLASTEDIHFHFKKLKKFGYTYGDEFIFTFDQVESLELGLDALYGLSINQVDEIIKRNKKLVEIGLSIKYENDFDSIYDSKELKRLSKIKIRSIDICSDVKLDFVRINEPVVEFLNRECSATIVKFKYAVCLGKTSK